MRRLESHSMGMQQGDSLERQLPPPQRVAWGAEAGILGMSLTLAAAVVLLDLVLPGLPGASAGLISRLMAFMSSICPQRPAHSYTLGGAQLPIEARMMGMFGGLVMGVFFFATVGRWRRFRYPARTLGAVVLLGLAFMGFDGVNATLYDLGLPHAYAPDLRVRLITGLLAGIAMAFYLVPTVATVESSSATSAQSRPPSWRDYGWVLLACMPFGLLVASGWGLALLPLAFIGAGGVVLALLLINRTFLGAGATLFPAWNIHSGYLAGLAAVLAIGELMALAALRHVAGFEKHLKMRRNS